MNLASPIHLFCGIYTTYGNWLTVTQFHYFPLQRLSSFVISGLVTLGDTSIVLSKKGNP